MKKLVLVLLGIFCLVGCTSMNTPTKKTEELLMKYQSLSDDVLSDLDLSAEAENLGSTNTQTYKDVMTRQYQDLKYEITDENINGDEAIVTAKVTVYDLYKTMKEAQTYSDQNTAEFQTNGTYDQSKFFTYELDQMLKTDDTIDYTIDFYLEKVDNEWQIKELSNSIKEKLHGTYDYESE